MFEWVDRSKMLGINAKNFNEYINSLIVYLSKKLKSKNFFAQFCMILVIFYLNVPGKAN